MGFLGDVLGIGESSSQKKARKLNVANQAGAFDIYKGLLGRNRGLFAMAEANMLQLIPELTKGWDAAISSATRAGDASLQEATDRGAQTTAGAEQDLISTGLRNTTARGNVKNQIASNVSRERQTIRSDVGGQVAGLQAGKAGALMAGRGLLADFLQRQYSSELATANQGIGVRMGVQYEGSPSQFPALLAGAGQAAGGAASLIALCDRRLKQDILCIGVVQNIPIYEFSYRGARHYRYQGPMAQDLELLFPEAVYTLEGYLAIHNEMLPEGARLRRVA